MWQIKWEDRAHKELKKLDASVQKSILKFTRERIMGHDNPRQRGQPLLHDKSGLWRYRVGDYRLICQIEDSCFTVLVVACGHRKEIYDH